MPTTPIPDQKAIRAAVVEFFDEHQKRARSTGLHSREVAEAVRAALPRRARAAGEWQHRLWNVKALWVHAGILRADRHGLWLFDRCPHQCDVCPKMCRYTGTHEERHRCKDHMGPGYP